MHPCRGESLQVRAFIRGGGRPPSGTDKAFFCWRGGGYSNTPPPPPLFQAPCLPWGIWCAFRAGFPAFPPLGDPLPPVDRSRVIVEHALDRPGGGSSLGSLRACCSCSHGAPWRGRFFRRAPISAALSYTCCGLRRRDVDRQTPPSLPSLTCGAGTPAALVAPGTLRTLFLHAVANRSDPPPPLTQSPTAPPPFRPPPPLLALAIRLSHANPPGGTPPPPPWSRLPWRRRFPESLRTDSPQYLMYTPPLPPKGGGCPSVWLLRSDWRVTTCLRRRRHRRHQYPPRYLDS